MIKMIAGVFGLEVNGIVKAMDKTSDPFNASKEQEDRLVKLGLAVYVDAPTEEEEPADLPEGVVGIPEYSEETSAKELREIGKLCGLTFKVGMSKAEMVAALDAHIEANLVEGVEIGEGGEVTIIEDGDAPADEDAPTFDAAEAVQ